MSRSRFGTVLLAWLLVWMGGAALAACLILPPWLEVRALREQRRQAETRIHALEQRVEQLARQIKHLQDDPAYVERIGRSEFGLTPPGVELIPVQPVNRPAPASAPATGGPGAGISLADRIATATRNEPLVAVFVLDQSRPFVMVLGAAAALVGLVLLAGRPARPPQS